MRHSTFAHISVIVTAAIPSLAQSICSKPVYSAPFATNRLTTLGNELYLTGLLAQPGAHHRIATYDGASFTLLPGDFNAPIQALASTSLGLVAAGKFTALDGQPIARIARFDGAAWHALANGIDSPGDVRALAELGDSIYAAGSFTSASGAACANIARFDGASWHALGAGLDAPAEALIALADTLYIGGAFTVADGQPLVHAAAWDGSGFFAAAPNTLPVVRDFALGGTRLYAAANDAFVLEDGVWQRVGHLGTQAGVDARSIALVDGMPWVAGEWSTFCLVGTGDPCMAVARYVDGEWDLAATDDMFPSFANLALAGLDGSMYVSGLWTQSGSKGLHEFADELDLGALTPKSAPWYASFDLTLHVACMDASEPVTVRIGDSAPLATTVVSSMQLSVHVPAAYVPACGLLDVTLEQGADIAYIPQAFELRPSLEATVYSVFGAHVDFDVNAASNDGKAWCLWSPGFGATALPVPGLHGLFSLQPESLQVLGTGTLAVDPTVRVPYVPLLVPDGLTLAVQALTIEFAPGGPYTALTNAVQVVIP